MNKSITISIILLSLAIACQAIEVSGDVYGTWSADNNPYEVIGDLRVPQCSTLIIETGCYIDFQGRYKFLIDTMAAFQAIGNENDSIVFTTADTALGWFGLRFFSADSVSELSYCIVEWGKAASELDTITDETDYYGGGIFCENSNLSITHCLIRLNESSPYFGGGIYCSNSNLDIVANIISDNHAGWGGAGIFCEFSNVNIGNNIIDYNRTFYPLGGEFWGGAIGCVRSTVLISDNIIQYNFCGISGGGIFISGSSAIITNNDISHNRVWDSGGGIAIIDSSTVLLVYNIIANNTVCGVDGGGIINHRSHLTAANNTIVGNRASRQGGAIWARQGINDTLINNIIRDNEADEGSQIYELQETLTVIYSNIEDGWPGEGNIDADPLFCEPDTGNFYLAENSPCVGTGFNGANMGAYGIGCDPVSIIEHFSYLPDDFELFQNHPNPFNARTTIRYNLSIPADITIDIYDILGRKVETLISIKQPAGEHQVIWDAMDKSSGMYFYKLQAEDCVETKKMLLLK
ncbi:MAG: T9SS type A sorting domain-containing protein [candidate division Zixibacteria bacterium]|nr:T9SS type A sorting domain-containing protein [candidate division Zixibacteria bacterium]